MESIQDLKNKIKEIEKTQKANWAKFGNILESQVLIINNTNDTKRIVYEANNSLEVGYILNNIKAFNSDMGVFDYGGTKVFSDSPIQYAIKTIGNTWELTLTIYYKLLSGDEINIKFSYDKMEQETKNLFSITKRSLNDIEIPRFRGNGFSSNDINSYRVRVLEFGIYETLRYYGGYRTLVSSVKTNEIINYFKSFK